MGAELPEVETGSGEGAEDVTLADLHLSLTACP